jgi:hypothetical protein
MSWSFSQTGTPPQVKAGLEQHIRDNPLQGHEKAARAKLVDIVAEIGKDYDDEEQMSFVGSGSLKAMNVSITPVPVV